MCTGPENRTEKGRRCGLEGKNGGAARTRASVFKDGTEKASDPGDRGTAAEFSYGYGGYHDGQQCGPRGDLSGFSGGLHQYSGDTGIFGADGRRRHCLRPLYGQQKRPGGQPLRAAAAADRGGAFRGDHGSVPGIPRSAAPCDLWYRGPGSDAKLGNLFFLYGAFLPLYRPVRRGGVHFPLPGKYQAAHGHLGDLEFPEYRRKRGADLGLRHGSRRRGHPHPGLPDLLRGGGPGLFKEENV